MKGSAELSFKDRWRKAWQNSAFKFQFAACTLFLLLIATFISDFFNYIELRQGYEIDDFLLNYLTPRNLSVYIFVMLYTVIITSIFHLFFYPAILLKCFQAYVLLTILRVLTLSLISLEPSPSIIPLADPIVDYFFYGNNIITKDLFFLGHISTLLLMVYYNPLRPLKYVFLALTILTSIFILCQHVHYTIDIVAAVFFSFICYKLANAIPLKVNT